MDFNNQKGIQALISLLKQNNIQDLVISPGGTNIPIVKEVQDDPFFSCYSVVDERSAVYMAIGIYLQKKRPIALVCTSAQATRNYIPGLTEAFYKRVPILAITMEKHPRFKYQEYMQAPDQTSLPRDCVKESFELPVINDSDDYMHAIRLINQSILELSKNGLGPVQLCIPWVDSAARITDKTVKMISRYNCKDIAEENLGPRKVLIVVGEQAGLSEDDLKAINQFCQRTNSVIYTNHLSNFKNDYSVSGNLILSTLSNSKEIDSLSPDLLITIGGQTGDYPLFNFLNTNNSNNFEHWRISPDGEVVDSYDRLTRIYQGSVKEFFEGYKGSDKTHSYLAAWKIEPVIDIAGLPFSSTTIAGYLHDRIPENSIIQFSIYNAVRIWNLFSLDPSIECFSNVGAFGIDGGLSTLIGQSLVTDKLAFMIIGDLAFLYDMNSISNRHIKNNIRILLINNNGGVEFKIYGDRPFEKDRYISAAGHFKNAKGWAETCGFEYLSAKTMDEFTANVDKFVGPSDKPILLEAFVSDSDESAAFLSVINSNRQNTGLSKLKHKLRSLVSD